MLWLVSHGGPSEGDGLSPSVCDSLSLLQVQAKASQAGGEVDEAGVATALCHLWLEYLAASSAAAPSAGLDAALAAYSALVSCPLVSQLHVSLGEGRTRG